MAGKKGSTIEESQIKFEAVEELPKRSRIRKWFAQIDDLVEVAEIGAAYKVVVGNEGQCRSFSMAVRNYRIAQAKAGNIIRMLPRVYPDYPKDVFVEFLEPKEED